ncbi:MAG: tRNA 4-thiouridine(8) synthase ThiI [Bacilli bacterium]|nr:tRNA 4-thiouridine(8) synthase ThiI [Bacilli bacterium]
MNRVILIRYGELSTKKGNRNFFVKTLTKNIEHKLKNYSVKIQKDLGRMYIYFEDKDLDDITNILKNIFGIQMYHVAYIVNTNSDDITKSVLSILSSISFKTFKVEVKRSFKGFEYDSPTFCKVLGSAILRNVKDIKVDVHNPEILVNVEIRENESFIYLNSFKGAGGYPVGSQPRGLLMLSGGIDSPVAGYLAMKRGIKVDCVYFEAIPHTSLEAREKVVSLVKKLVNYTDNINLHIVNFTKIQEAIYRECDHDYVITIMRRMMYRIMDMLCEKLNSYVIINGESIGQVASQTLVSMNTINSVTNIPVVRPVACLDKLEIIDIAKKIDTYDISILPYEDCCTVFVPKHPVINPDKLKCEVMEQKFDYNTMLKETVDNVLTIRVSDYEDVNELL